MTYRNNTLLRIYQNQATQQSLKTQYKDLGIRGRIALVPLIKGDGSYRSEMIDNRLDSDKTHSIEHNVQDKQETEQSRV